MPVSGEPIIEAQGIERRFGNHQALEGIDLSIFRGEIFGIVGADGAGKTTLIQILAAILDPSAGQCRVLGFDTVREAAEVTARIGYMAQGFTLYERLSVTENLAFAARIRGVGEQKMAERQARLLDMAGLSRFPHRREGALSGGMRKKLALCSSLIHEPALLLLDEPGLGVDPLSRRELWTMLRRFRSEGTTIVFTTSYMDEAQACDRLLFLDGGRSIALGSPSDLSKRAAGAVFYLETDRKPEADLILQRHSVVVTQQWHADGLRFQIGERNLLPDDLRKSLDHIGRLTSVSPLIEDVFSILRAERSRKNVSEPAAPHPLTIAKDAPSKDTTAIEAHALTQHFGSFIAVDNVNLTMHHGEIFGLLGPNGAGKTTLIRLLCGLLRPSEGSALVSGINVAKAPNQLRGQIGYMSQRFSLYFDMTVGENLSFFASVYGLSGHDAQGAIRWALRIVGLEGMEAYLARDLSGAIRQRLALASSLLHNPQVLFLDEPTAGVDPLSRHRFWRLINLLASQGMAVLVTTHYLEEAAYCARLGLMYDGRLVATGTLPALRADIRLGPEKTIEDVFVAYIDRERRTNEGGRKPIP